MVQFPGWMRKNFMPGNFSWRVSAEKWDASWVFQTLATIFSELKRCIFQISLKYIKLVIPKILFILALWSFNFYFKITATPPTPSPAPQQNYAPPQQYDPPIHQYRNFWPLLQQRPLKSLTSPPPPQTGGRCMPLPF